MSFRVRHLLNDVLNEERVQPVYIYIGRAGLVKKRSQETFKRDLEWNEQWWSQMLICAKNSSKPFAWVNSLSPNNILIKQVLLFFLCYRWNWDSQVKLLAWGQSWGQSSNWKPDPRTHALKHLLSLYKMHGLCKSPMRSWRSPEG